MPNDANDPSRRSLLKGSAVGAGALLGVAGMSSTRAAAHPSTSSPNDANPNSPNGYFLKLEGITGEASLDKIAGYIQLTSFSFGLTRGASEGRPTGKEAGASTLHFSAPISKASPAMMVDAVNGKVLKSASLTLTHNGSGLNFLKIELTDVVISSFEVTADDEDPESDLRDNGALNFAKIEYSYAPTLPSGGLAPPIVVKWNTRSAKPI